MLLSNVPPTTLHIKLISASGLTKSHNYQVQCTMYADQRLQKPFWSTRFFSGESAVIKNTQNPVFNYEVDIPLPDRPTMVDLRLVDLSYRGREVGRVRMKFLDEPGIERTLDGKDLLYGFDGTFITSSTTFIVTDVGQRNSPHQSPSRKLPREKNSRHQCCITDSPGKDGINWSRRLDYHLRHLGKCLGN